MARRQKMVTKSKMSQGRQRKHLTTQVRQGHNKTRDRRRREGSDITEHAEVIMFHFIVLCFPLGTFHPQELIITWLRENFFAKMVFDFFFLQLQWYTVHVPLSVADNSLTHTQATPATSKAWKKKVAGGSGKKVGFALCGCFQVLIMVAQTLHVAVCVCRCGFVCVQACVFVCRGVIRLDTNLPQKHAAAHYFTFLFFFFQSINETRCWSANRCIPV